MLFYLLSLLFATGLIFCANGTDVDECLLGSHKCHVEATCMNTNGSYTCKCKDWFAGDGFNCRGYCNINCSQYCNKTCSISGRCIEGPNGYTCYCYSRGSTCKNAIPLIRNIQIKAMVAPTSILVVWEVGNAYHAYVSVTPGVINRGYSNSAAYFEALVPNTHYTITISASNYGEGTGKSINYFFHEVLTSNNTSSQAETDIIPVDSHCNNETHCCPGFVWNGTNCQDIDECSLGTQDCHIEATCHNTNGSFFCKCNNWTAGDGKNCFYFCGCVHCFEGHFFQTTCQLRYLDVDIRHLRITWKNNTAAIVLWEQGPSSYTVVTISNMTWSANYGYHFQQISFTNLQPNSSYSVVVQAHLYPKSEQKIVNFTTDSNKSLINGSSVSTINTIQCDNVTKTCGNGYKLQNRLWQDINECLLGGHDCHIEALCHNTNGSYVCKCKDWFVGDGKRCVGYCSSSCGYCRHGANGYTCFCKANCTETPILLDLQLVWKTSTSLGFTWRTGNAVRTIAVLTGPGDGAKQWEFNFNSAVFINLSPGTKYNLTITALNAAGEEIISTNFNTDNESAKLPIVVSQSISSCENILTQCCTGYVQKNGSCVDINECTIGIHNCHEEATCFNTKGSFTCQCNTGFAGDGINCVGVCYNHDSYSYVFSWSYYNVYYEDTLFWINCRYYGACSSGIFGSTCKCIVPLKCIAKLCCLKVVSQSQSYLTFEWDKNEKIHSYSYNVELRTTNSSKKIAYYPDIQPSHATFGDLIPGTQYTITVFVSPSYSAADSLNYTTATISASGPNVSVISVGVHDITIAYIAIMGAKHYQIVYQSGNGSERILTTITNYTIPCLLENTGYNITVYAVYEATIGEPSTPILIATENLKGKVSCGVANPCHSNATCKTEADSYICACIDGFTGNGRCCSDINECILNTDNCHVNATCKNTIGSYICSCENGFTGSGTNCDDIDECFLRTDNCHMNAMCNNTVGGFICSCKEGFEGDGFVCMIVDQCSMETHDCDVNAECENVDGNVTCTCNSGYEGNGKMCHKLYLHEFSQNFTSNRLSNERLKKKLQENLLKIFQHGNDDVRKVIIQNIETNLTVRYLVQFSNGFQPPTVLLSGFVKFSNKNSEGLLLGIPRTTSCQEKTVQGFSFPEISVNSMSYSGETCPRGYSQASLRCIPVVSFGADGELHSSQFDLSSVSVIKCEVKIEDIKINASEVTQEEVEEIANSLQIITSGSTLEDKEVEESLKVVDSIAQAITAEKVEVTETLLINVVTTTSHLTQSLQVTQGNTDNSNKDQSVTRQSIVQSLSLLAHKFVFGNKTDSALEIKTKLIVVRVTEQSQESSPTDVWFAPERDVESIVPVNISVPSSVISQAWKRSNGLKLRTVFFLHEGDSLFPSKTKVDFVISVEIGDSSISLINLYPPVSIKHANEKTHYGEKSSVQALKVKRVRQRCAYWDFDAVDWKTDGCCLDNTARPPVCRCDHLTNFALLVSTIEIPDDVVLSTISDIGCGISILGFIVTIILHLLNKPQLKKVPNQIQLHICTNLLVAYLVFSTGVSSVDNPEACKAVTALIQYTFLTSWMWMAVYSNKLYTALVKVFNIESKSYMTKACILSYGFPAMVVGFNLILTLVYFDKQQVNGDFCVKDDPQYLPSTTYHAENMCWLHGYSLYFGFLFIIGLVFLNNLVILFLVLRKVIFKRQKIQSTAAKHSKLNQLFMACSLSFTLGLTWIFGFLMLFSTDPTYNQIMNWLFALFNSFQGVFVFYITCVKREDMFIFWWHPFQARFAGLRKRFQDAVGIEPTSSDLTMATKSTGVSATKSNFSSTSA